MKRLVALVLIVSLAAVLASCAGPQAAPSRPTPASIKITSAPVLLTKVGQTAQLQAVVYDGNGNAMAGRQITWSSSSSSTISVSGTGLVTANASVGSAIITASNSGLSAQSLVPIAQLAPATVKIDKSLVDKSQVNSASSITVTLENRGAAANLVVGDIILSNAGIMARVTSLTNNGATITALATPVTINDAFTALRFTATSTSPTITTSISPQGVRLTSTSPLIAPQSLDLSAVKCVTSSGAPVTLDVTAGSLTYTLNPSFTPSGGKQPGGKFYFSAVASLKPRVSIVSPSLTLNAGTDVTATCTVPALKPITLPTPITLYGVVSLHGLITPVVGFSVTGSVTGASITVAGPSLMGAGADASFGISYASGRWSTTHTATRVPGTFKPLTFTADGNPSLDFILSPFVEPKLGLSVDVAIFHAAGVDFVEPKLALGFKFGLTGPFAVNKPTYTGPDWSADLAASANFNLSLSGALAHAFNLLGIDTGIPLASFNLFTWQFLHSPQPAVTPGATTVTNTVTLSSRAPTRYQGETLEFWGYPTGATVASKLATATIQSNGTATTSWTPTSGDNGSMHIYAAIYGDAFKALNYPYVTPVASRPALAINVNSNVRTFGGFSSPGGVAVDSSSDIWVVNGNSTVTRLSAGGSTIRTYSDSLPAGGGATADGSGNIWLYGRVPPSSGTGPLSGRVAELNSSGTVISSFPVPYGITGFALDSSRNVWLSEYGTGYVNERSPSGLSVNTFYSPNTVGGAGLAFDASGRLWFVGYNTDNVVKFDSSGTVIASGSVGSYPNKVAIDPSGNVWVLNGGGNGVTELSATGTTIQTYAVGATPGDIAIDQTGNIWIVNGGSNNVTELSPTGSFKRTYAVGASPSGIAIDGSGNVWISNSGDNTVTELMAVATGPQYGPLY